MANEISRLKNGIAAVMSYTNKEEAETAWVLLDAIQEVLSGGDFRGAKRIKVNVCLDTIAEAKTKAEAYWAANGGKLDDED